MRTVEIQFINNSIRKMCENNFEKYARKKSLELAISLQEIFTYLEQSPNLADFKKLMDIFGKDFHDLCNKGGKDFDGCYGISIIKAKKERLVLKPINDPLPLKPDNQTPDFTRIDKVMVVFLDDYH